MKRIYYPHSQWEETRYGMWRKVYGEERVELLKEAIRFTGNARLYGAAMWRVIQEWPISCAHSLTATALNRQAWLGHAACCLEIGCPEEVTREAWKHLSRKQQDEADEQARLAIEEWERVYRWRRVDTGPQMGLF